MCNEDIDRYIAKREIATQFKKLKLTVMGDAGEEDGKGGVDFPFPSGNSFPDEFDDGDVLQLPDPDLRRSPRMEGILRVQ